MSHGFKKLTFSVRLLQPTQQANKRFKKYITRLKLLLQIKKMGLNYDYHNHRNIYFYGVTSAWKIRKKLYKALLVMIAPNTNPKILR